MNHLILFLLVVLSIEIFKKSSYLSLIDLLLKKFLKIKKIIINKKSSDNWKEKIIPAYSFDMMKISFRMLLITLVIIFIFIFIFKNFI